MNICSMKKPEYKTDQSKINCHGKMFGGKGHIYRAPDFCRGEMENIVNHHGNRVQNDISEQSARNPVFDQPVMQLFRSAVSDWAKSGIHFWFASLINGVIEKINWFNRAAFSHISKHPR